ncbi:MAG TPA: outer membrane beta-barrel protein [Candidatus Binatia bacterium]|nr:outer membrane beta-barrel protein [Candidatus Binatia bacterium]
MQTKTIRWLISGLTLGMVMGMLLAPSSWAGNAAADDGATAASATAPAATVQPAKSESAAADKAKVDSDAQPPSDPAAQPSNPAPAPAPAKSGSDPHIKPGSNYPHWEWFMGYSYLNGRVGSGIKSYNGNGGSTSLEYNLNHWIGLVADLGGYETGKIGDVGVNVTQFTYLFGPRLNYRFGDNERHTLFGQVLLGGDHTSASFAGLSGSDNTFAMSAGGGLDLGLTKHLALRLAQVEYLMSRFDLPGYHTQNDMRFSTGLVLRWGAKPIIVNKPPTAACSADAASIVQGSGGAVPVRANASDPDGDSLTYAWSASGGRVDGSGPTARWTPGDAPPGSYTITARVDDGHGGTASCSANVAVEPRPLRPPTLTCSVDRNAVLPGEIVNVTADGSSPEGFPLDYTWRANGGRVTGSGSRVQFDTSGLAPGDYSITGRASDGHGGAADCVAGVHVNAPAPKPQPVKLGECIFKPGSTRVDNKCSRLLDDAVLRMQNDPAGTLVLIGYEDPVKEKKGNIAQTRAENAKKYAAKGKGKGAAGVDPNRVNTRKGAGAEGADTANRRVEVIWVPEGATF